MNITGVDTPASESRVIAENKNVLTLNISKDKQKGIRLGYFLSDD